MRSNIVDIECIFQTRTQKAICVREHETAETDVWLPLSQVEYEPAGPLRGMKVTVSMPEGLAQDKGLI